jgi:DNA-binding CsgD family transcriptional regulator
VNRLNMTTAPPLIVPEPVREFLVHQARSVGCIAVQAPSGYGKTLLLREIARIHESAGLPVIDYWRDPATPRTGDGVLLVDDAHTLDTDTLHGLRDMVAAGRCRLIVTHRPWPRPAALVALIEALRRHSPPLVLGPFTEEQTSAYLTATLDAPAPATLARFVHAQTMGVPGHVDRLTSALEGYTEDVRPGHAPALPAWALASFAADLEVVGPAVRGLLLAAASGLDISLAIACALLGRTAEEVEDMLAATRSASLLGPGGRLSPIVRQAVVAHSSPTQRDAVWRHLAELHLHHGGPALPLVRTLRRAGLGDTHLTPALLAAADEVLADDPALAADLLAAAASAGGKPEPLRLAKAAALTGDLDAALRLADRVLAGPDPSDRTEAAVVSAAALAHRGHLGRSAELYRWSNTPSSAAFAAIAAIASGRPDDLTAATDQPSTAPPTLVSGAALLMARGMRETLSSSPTAALSSLTQAASLLEPAGQAELLPDSPAALAAIVALHCCEFDIGSSVLRRAVDSHMGGALMARRHRLLLAWIQMMRGRTTTAAEILATASDGGAAMEPRDLLFAAALEVGIARRDSDLPALIRGWEKAREAIMRHPVDLFTLLPLGEFAIAAARVGEPGLLSGQLREAHLLLERLGKPPLWTTALHWSNLHAAIISEDEPAAAERVAALAGVRHTRYGAVAAQAAESWWHVWHGVVDPSAVEAAAHGLNNLGLHWDAARLAGQAAIRTSDRRAMTALLEYARLLQPKPAARKATGDREPDLSGHPEQSRAASVLTEREQEVADLVLAGLTYRQVGEKLFISAKTVEHHMARIRHRLGCSSRGEMLAKLRSMAIHRGGPNRLSPDGAASPSSPPQ